MKARITRMTSLFPNGHFIQWTIDDARDSGIYSTTIFRAGGPDGPWELLATGLADQYAYYDKFEAPVEVLTNIYLKPNQLRMFRNYYYKVEVTTPTGVVLTALDEVGPLLQNRKLEGVRRKAIRDLERQLKIYNGTAAALLKKRVWGTRCKDCWSPVTKEVVRAGCRSCWGTSFLGGYWAPTLVYARRGAMESSTAITSDNKSDANQVRIWMRDLPAMERDDIVVFLEDQKRYRIDRQLQTEMKLVAVHQVFTAQEIPHDNIIYKLPVDTRGLQPLV